MYAQRWIRVAVHRTCLSYSCGGSLLNGARTLFCPDGFSGATARETGEGSSPMLSRGGRTKGPTRVAEYEGTIPSGNWSKLYQERQLSDVVEALHLGVRIDEYVLYEVLERCIAQKDLVLGSHVHGLAVKCGYESNTSLANKIICMYSSHGKLEDATKVFFKVAAPSLHMWASIILAHARHGQPSEAVRLYRRMRQSPLKPHNRIFVAALKACSSAGDLSSGREVHADFLEYAEKPDIFVGTCLVDMYSKCGSLEDARNVFDSLRTKDVVTWNALLGGYAQHGLGEEALSLYEIMQQEGVRANHVTFVCLLQACGSISALHQGKQFHAQIQERGIESDTILGNGLVSMYAKCGSMEDARRVFNNMPSRNVVTWTAMIAGYAQQGLGHEALALYGRMQQEGITLANRVTFVCLLQACASVENLYQGKQLHTEIQARGLEADVVVGTCLVDMYAKCGSLGAARRVFDNLSTRDVVAWTAMIGGYAQHGFSQESLSLYIDMKREGTIPAHPITFISLLDVCGSVAALEKGKEIHADISKAGLQDTDSSVANALIDMYCKCGSMANAQQVFNKLGMRGTVTWSSLIAGYARQGKVRIVFDLFQRMRQEGIQPDCVTFLGLLTVCSHVGFVNKGQKYFASMSHDYGISPSIEHYTCMVDLLGRAGKVEKAMEMAKKMPFQPDAVVWSSILGACRKWSKVELGKKAFECAVKLDKHDAAAYVLMSNIYAAAKMHADAKKIQAMRAEAQAWKKPGQSWWTDSRGIVHTFVVGDRDHPECQDIDSKLRALIVRLKKEGYVPHLDSVLRNIPDNKKEAALCGHSEKLAIAYALHKTPQGTTIRIVKNLRVCEDCHRATALISKMEQRTIICRDASRFHVFKDGKCSCGGYW